MRITLNSQMRLRLLILLKPCRRQVNRKKTVGESHWLNEANPEGGGSPSKLNARTLMKTLWIFIPVRRVTTRIVGCRSGDIVLKVMNRHLHRSKQRGRGRRGNKDRGLLNPNPNMGSRVEKMGQYRECSLIEGKPQDRRRETNPTTRRMSLAFPRKQRRLTEDVGALGVYDGV